MPQIIDKQLKRSLGLDIAKGICIILMVIGHSYPPPILHDVIYMFHMPCFFMISGYLLKPSYIQDIPLFVKKRLKSLWYPFFIWTVAFILLHNIFYNLQVYSDYYSIKDIGINIGKAFVMTKSEQLLGGFWFLRSLLFASIISVIWYKYILPLGNKQWMLILGILLSLALAILIKSFNLNFRYFNSVNFLSTGFFMTGTFVSQIKISVKFQKTIIVASIILLGISALYMPCNILKISTVEIIPYYIVASAISYSIIAICFYAKPSKYINWIATVGGRTMDVLIFHFLALKIVSLIKCWHYDMPLTHLTEFPVIAENNEYYWIIYSIVGVVLSLLMATVIDRLKTLIFNKKNCLTRK